jgi:pimeloyl-ACP methyl ester carboxylesterase
VLFLHGIMGTKANWRGIAKRLVDMHTDLGAVLVDLRLHGESRAFSPPHTLVAAASDVAAFADGFDGHIVAVVGHSLGGKVALVWARDHAAALAARGRPLHAVISVDSMPGLSPMGGTTGEVTRVLDWVETRAPQGPVTRDAFLEAAVADGLSPALAQWLAMNLTRRAVEAGGGLELRLDVTGLRALLASHLALDLWPVVEAPPAGVAVHLVAAGRSANYDAAARARARELAEAGRITLTEIPDAGHWVHVDAPDATLATLAAALP